MTLPFDKFLMVLSAASFIVGTAFLAKSIKWQSEELKLDENSELARNISQMGSPGRPNAFRLAVGMILNAVGYGLLIVSIVIFT